MFTRQHYKAIAEIINKASIKYDYEKMDRVILLHELQVYFKADNPNFQPSKFVDACNAR